MTKDHETVETEFGKVLSRDPNVMSGALVFAGTRVPLDALFEAILDGMSLDEFGENFPTVERWQVDAAIRIGARLVASNFAASRASGTS